MFENCKSAKRQLGFSESQGFCSSWIVQWERGGCYQGSLMLDIFRAGFRVGLWKPTVTAILTAASVAAIAIGLIARVAVAGVIYFKC
jgi:hypothetical protein